MLFKVNKIIIMYFVKFVNKIMCNNFFDCKYVCVVKFYKIFY